MHAPTHAATLSLGLVWIFGMAGTPPTHASTCSAGEPLVSLHTGQDADGDGFDDRWTVVVPGSTTPIPALVATTPVAGWRGTLDDTGPYNMGFRYPVLGDGQWLGPLADAGTFTFETVFDLPECVHPVIVAEWDADNSIEILLNGLPVGVASNPAVAPPLPWLSNVDGPADPLADPTTGLVTPSCEPPLFRCN
ncbi:MAG: hypothetical protein AAFX50_26110, partial [Acidobacteriota bacterium]